MSLVITKRPETYELGVQLQYRSSFNALGSVVFTTNTHAFTFSGSERIYIESDKEEYNGYWEPVNTGSTTTFKIKNVATGLEVVYTGNTSYAKIWKCVLSNLSKWNAVGNPIVYKAIRRDFVFNQINNVGSAQIQFNSINVSASFVVGDTIWVESNNGVYSTQATVTGSVFSAPNTLVTLNTTYTSVAPGGYVNLTSKRLNYKVMVSVFSGGVNLGTLRVSPDKKGNLLFDVSRILWSTLSPEFKDDLNYNNLGSDTYSQKSFAVKYQETWIGGSETEVDDTSNIYYCIYGAKQIGDLYGGGLPDYTFNTAGVEMLSNGTFTGSLTGWSNFGTGIDWVHNANTARVNGTGSSKNLTQLGLTFKQGKLYIISVSYETGNPSVSIIFSLSDGTNRQTILISSTALEVNTNTFFVVANNNYDRFELSGTSNNYLYVNTVSCVDTTTSSKFLTKFENLKMWRGFPFTLSAIWGPNSGNSVYRVAFFIGVNRRTVQDGDTTDKDDTMSRLIVNNVGSGIFESDTSLMVYGFSVSNGIISEIKKIQIENPCKNPLLLYWRNSLGGDSWWMFDINQDYSTLVSDGKNKRVYVLTAENITLNEWESLNELNSSGETYNESITILSSAIKKTNSTVGSQVYAVDKDGNLTGVTVIPSENTTRTRQQKHTFTLKIEYPEILTT